MSFKEFTKELNGSRVEGELIKTILYSLLTSFILLGILYYVKLKTISDFVPKYGFFIFFASLSVALIIPAMRQVRAYKQLPCMSGMMIGMTVGMISGFLIGFLIGATNGMFIGGVAGMAMGIVMGIYTGNCCGIMGAMEGIMAGFMGGIMGAMTSVMLLNDNLKAATIIVYIVSAIIMISLNYMIYKESRDIERVKNEDYMLDIFITMIIISFVTWIMLYGPRSFLFG
mgnify:FL=1